MSEDIQFTQYSSMYTRARQLEKTEPDKALDIYFEILSKFTPSGTAYYERPCILLERQGRYEEAIRICYCAIGVANNGSFNFKPDEFTHRVDRLKRKRDGLPSQRKQATEPANLEPIRANNRAATPDALFPEKHISVSFGKSTSINFTTALHLAKVSPQYIENVVENNPVYQAVYDATNPNEYINFIQLYELVSKWKSCFVIMNGKIMDRKIIGKLNYCYGDKCRSGSSRFCYGASIATENPFGCHRLQISNYNNPWWSFGHFLSRNVWFVDKEAIEKRIREYSQEYIMCPALSHDTIFRELQNLPTQIDLNVDRSWVRSSGTIQPRDFIYGSTNDTLIINENRRIDNDTRSTSRPSGCLTSIMIVIFVTIFMKILL